MDPKLIAARAEIEQTLKKHDIAGWVVLHNAPGEVEVFSRLDPSYSVLRPQTVEGGMSIRVLSRLSDYNGNKERQMHDLAATASMAHCFAETLSVTAVNMTELTKVIDRETGAKHSPLRPSPRR